MIPNKIWKLYKSDATNADATFIMGLGCEVEVIVPEWQEFTSASGTRGRYLAENPYIEIKTISEKQESMLYLKYGNQLELAHEFSYENFNMVPHSRPAA